MGILDKLLHSHDYKFSNSVYATNSNTGESLHVGELYKCECGSERFEKNENYHKLQETIALEELSDDIDKFYGY